MEDFEKGIKAHNLARQAQIVNDSKSMDDFLVKGKELPIGTERKHGGRLMVKTAQGWRPKGGEGKSSKEITKKDLVEVPKGLTSDPKKKQGQYGTVVDVTDNGRTVHVKFDDGVVGQYDSSSLNKLSRLTDKDKEKLSMVDDIDRKDFNKIETALMNRGVSAKQINDFYYHELDKHQKNLLQNIAKHAKKEELYDAVNRKYGTKFKVGDIEEFEDNDMRTQLDDSDIKAIVDAEKEDALKGKGNLKKALDLIKGVGEKLKGGKGDGKTLEGLVKKHGVDIKTLQSQFKQGVKVEMEHTKDESKAKEIVMDHLTEDAHYYSKLAEMEEEI